MTHTHTPSATLPRLTPQWLTHTVHLLATLTQGCQLAAAAYGILAVAVGLMLAAIIVAVVIVRRRRAAAPAPPPKNERTPLLAGESQVADTSPSLVYTGL
jgi:hypothetical protein